MIICNKHQKYPPARRMVLREHGTFWAYFNGRAGYVEYGQFGRYREVFEYEDDGGFKYWFNIDGDLIAE